MIVNVAINTLSTSIIKMTTTNINTIIHISTINISTGPQGEGLPRTDAVRFQRRRCNPELTRNAAVCYPQPSLSGETAASDGQLPSEISRASGYSNGVAVGGGCSGWG